MRTISGKYFWPAPFLSAVLLWLACFSLPAVTQNKKTPSPRIFVGLAAGFFYPQQGTFREIYDQAICPAELQLDWVVGRKLSIFGAARYLKTSGRTVLLSPVQPDETYALHWRTATLRLGMNYRFSASRFIPFIGAGGSYNFFQEQWPEASVVHKGQKAGFYFQAGGRYRLLRSWQALVQIEYSVVPAGRGAQGQVNLGGLSLSLGLLAGIF